MPVLAPLKGKGQVWETHTQPIRSDNWRDFRKKCLFQCGGPAGMLRCSARALAVVSFPTPALDCTTLSRWLERAELYYLIIAGTPFSLCMHSSQFGPASAASP